VKCKWHFNIILLLIISNNDLQNVQFCWVNTCIFLRSVSPLANISYPERLAALDLEPLELRRLKSDLVLYYKCLHDLVALPSSELLCQILSHKREQVVINCSVLYALLNFMKTTSLITMCLVGVVYHLQWLMLALFHVSNAFYLTVSCQLLHTVLYFNNL